MGLIYLQGSRSDDMPKVPYRIGEEQALPEAEGYARVAEDVQYLVDVTQVVFCCLLYTSPSPRDA